MLTRTRREWARRLTALLTVCSVPVLTAHGQAPLPSGAELVARYVAAIGGEAAWRALTSMRATGVIEVPAQNLRGTVEILTARPARSIIRMEIGGLGRSEMGFSDGVGWMIDPMVGPSLVTGKALAEMKNDAHFDATLHPPEVVTSIVTVGRVEFDGRQAFKATVTYVSGETRDEFFDAENGLLIGTEGVSETPMGKVPMKIILRDYKSFGAIKQPTRMVQSALGFEQHFVIDVVELNSVKPESLEPPAMIRAIIKKDSAPAIAARPIDVASFDDAWLTIRDTFYDPAFGGLDWEAVRTALRPKVLAAASPDEARAVIREMLATLKRSHFGLMSPATASDPVPTGSAVVAIDTRLIGADVVITRVSDGSEAARAGLKPGQVLVNIDDAAVAPWILAGAHADPRMTALNVWRRVHVALQGPDASLAKLTVRADGRDQVKTVRRERPAGDRIALGDLPPMYVHVNSRAVETPSGRGVGIIGFNVWMASANPLIEFAIDRHRAQRGLVIDLRGNPGGLAVMIRGVAGHLFDQEVVLGRMKTRDTELEFAANPRVVTADGRRVAPFSGPVALLVDELTASASECFAGGLQSLGRVRVFGRTTAGQALPASTKRLPNGDLLMYVVGDFVTGTGRRLEGEGVIPDEKVTLDVAALSAGRDPDLEAALRWLDSVKTTSEVVGKFPSNDL
jgi:carboxyl-terminal processing protease